MAEYSREDLEYTIKNWKKEGMSPRCIFEKLQHLKEEAEKQGNAWRQGEGIDAPGWKIKDRHLRKIVAEETLSSREQARFTMSGGRFRGTLPGNAYDPDTDQCVPPDQVGKVSEGEGASTSDLSPAGTGGSQNINVNIQGAGQGGGAGGGGTGGGTDWREVHNRIAQTVANVNGLGPAVEQQIRQQVTAMQNGNLSRVDLRNIVGGNRATKIIKHIVPIFEEFDIPYERPDVDKLTPGESGMVQRAKSLFERGEHGEKIAAVERIIDFLDASDPMRAKLLEWDQGALERAEEILWRDRSALEQYFDKERLRRLMRNMDNVQELERFRDDYLQGRASDVRDLEGVNVPSGVAGVPRYVMKKMVRSVEAQERYAPIAAIALAPVIALGGMGVGLGPFGIIFGIVFFVWGYRNLESRNPWVSAGVSVLGLYVGALDLIFIVSNAMLSVSSLMTLTGLASVAVLAASVYVIDWSMLRWLYGRLATVLFGPPAERDKGYELLFTATVILVFMASLSFTLGLVIPVAGSFTMLLFALSMLGPVALYHFVKKNHEWLHYRGGNLKDRLQGRQMGPRRQEPDYGASPDEYRKWADESRYQGQGGGRDMGAAGDAFERWDREEAEQRVENIMDGLGGGVGAGLLREAGQELLKRYEDGRVPESAFSEMVGRLRELAAEYREGELSGPRAIKELISEIKSGDWPGRGD